MRLVRDKVKRVGNRGVTRASAGTALGLGVSSGTSPQSVLRSPAITSPALKRTPQPTPLRVTCVNRAEAPIADGCIRHIGGLQPNGAEWRLPVASAIQGVKDGLWSLYLDGSDGHPTSVIVAEDHGQDYLRTAPDLDLPNSLPALPECPCYEAHSPIWTRLEEAAR
jgi:hypothetical protein